MRNEDQGGRLLAAVIAHTRTHAAHFLPAVLKEAFTPPPDDFCRPYRAWYFYWRLTQGVALGYHYWASSPSDQRVSASISG